MLVKSLKAPVIALLVIGGTHFVLEALIPDARYFFTPVVVGAILVAVGAWLGYRTAQNGGNVLNAALAGAIMGLLPIMLDIVGFGIILGRGVPQGAQAGVFGFSMTVLGSVIGSVVAMVTRRRATGI